MTAQDRGALKAHYLQSLLKPKWTEEKNAYQIQLKLRTEKQRKRLLQITHKR
jgi:hypothetical protein